MRGGFECGADLGSPAAAGAAGRFCGGRIGRASDGGFRWAWLGRAGRRRSGPGDRGFIFSGASNGRYGDRAIGWECRESRVGMRGDLGPARTRSGRRRASNVPFLRRFSGNVIRNRNKPAPESGPPCPPPRPGLAQYLGRPMGAGMTRKRCLNQGMGNRAVSASTWERTD